jgi:hypothetical protein
MELFPKKEVTDKEILEVKVIEETPTPRQWVWWAKENKGSYVYLESSDTLSKEQLEETHMFLTNYDITLF